MSDNYRDGCSGKHYGRTLAVIMSIAAWVFSKLGM